jgi:hypothetical protein
MDAPKAEKIFLLFVIFEILFFINLFVCKYAHGVEKMRQNVSNKKGILCVARFYFSYARKLDNIAVIDAYIMLLRSIQLGSVTLLHNMVDKNGIFWTCCHPFLGSDLVSIENKPRKIIFFSHV